jgi:hypothetical protein
MKDWILIIIAALGWLWGIIQFIINFHNQRKAKLIERKYIAYNAYMKKVDDIMNNVRTDPKAIYGINSNFLQTVLSGNVGEIDTALVKFNEELIEYVRKASEPLILVKQELNALLLICSDKLKQKISELIELTADFNNEMQQCLSIISPNDSNQMTRNLQTLAHNDRWLKFENLRNEIVELMRKEINAK